MSIRTKAKRRLRRHAATASVTVSAYLPPGRGPERMRDLVGRARVAEARRLLVSGDLGAAEQVLQPVLDDPQLASRAWALLAELRQQQGDPAGALEAARKASGAGAEPAFAGLLAHHRLTAEVPGEEATAALDALLDHRPRNRRELSEVFVVLRTADAERVERYRTNLEDWGFYGYDEQLAEAWRELELADTSQVPLDRLDEAVGAAAAYLRWPVPVVARALTRRREWDRLAAYADGTRLPDTAPLVHVKAAALELRRAAGLALSAGRTSAARTLAGHALALRPDDRFAQATWANASDQLAVVEEGWRSTARAVEPRYRPRDGAVLAVLAQSLPHTSGGYATRTHGVLTGLARLGYDVDAVTRPGFPYDRWPKRDPRVVEPVDIVDGIPYHRLLTEARSYPQYPLRRYVDKYAAHLEAEARAHRASVIHASSFHVNGLAAQAASARLGIPFVYEMRGLEELMKVSRDPDFEATDRYHFLAHLETEIALRADRVFVITEALRRLMIERGVPGEKLVVLPNGVHADRFEPRPRDAELEAELGVAGKAVIGYAGGLVDYEGLELLLEAVALLRERRSDFHVVVVGDGHHESQLHDLSARLGLGDLVTFTGRVPHEEVARYLSLFDVAPFPRLPLPVCEAISPIKPFESMAMGRAVLVSSVAALTEIVEDGVTGLVFDKGCATRLAEQLERLVDSPSLRASLGEAARAWVSAERDWSDIVGIVDRTYGELGVRSVPR